MHAVQVQCIKQCNDIFAELFDRVGARCAGGLSVPSRVVAQHPELLSNFGNLRSPHGIIRAKRIREHQCGRPTLAFQYVMNSGFARLNDGHRAYSSPTVVLSRLAATTRKCALLEAHALLDAFENQGNSLAHTDAHGAERISTIRSQKLIERCGYKPRATGAQRVPERNRTAVRIHVLGVVWNSPSAQHSHPLHPNSSLPSPAT